MNRLLLKMGNTGVVKGLRQRWVKHDNHCGDTSTGYRSLALGDLFAQLLIVPLTMCLCMLVSGLEWLLFKYDAFKLLVLGVGKR